MERGTVQETRSSSGSAVQVYIWARGRQYEGALAILWTLVAIFGDFPPSCWMRLVACL